MTTEGAEPKPLGVVGLTVDLSQAAAEREKRFAVLIDTRPDAKNQRRGLILRHPYWSGIRDESDPPLFYADAVVRWADEAANANDEQQPEFKAGLEYTDPVSVPNGTTPGISDYSGAWLASIHRVRVGPEQDRHRLGGPGAGAARRCIATRSRPPMATDDRRILRDHVRSRITHGTDFWPDVRAGRCAEVARDALPPPVGRPLDRYDRNRNCHHGNRGSCRKRRGQDLTRGATPAQSAEGREQKPGEQTPTSGL